MAEKRAEVVSTLDPIEEALLRAEANARGVTLQQVIDEKFAAGLDRLAGDFSAPKRPSKGRH